MDMVLRWALTIAGLTFVLSAGGRDVAGQVQSDSARAAEVWERALAAKGGRKLLASVRNILAINSPSSARRPSEVALFVFPEKYWRWTAKEGPIPMSVTVFDGKIALESIEGFGTVKQRGRNLGDEWFPISIQAVYLMETLSFKPRITKLESKRLGLTQYDVITAEFNGDRVLYYIDKRTSLVRRVYGDPDYRETKIVSTLGGYLELDEYKNIEGIMMPTRTTWERGRESNEFQLNVEYDSELFGRTPSFEEGLDGWKPQPVRANRPAPLPR